MTRRLLLLPLALVLAFPATAAADDRVIAPGVTAGGVDLGGQTIDTAVATLQLGVGAAAERAVTVRSAGRTFTLAAKDAGVRFDALTTAKRAYYAGATAGRAPRWPWPCARRRARCGRSPSRWTAPSRAPRATRRCGSGCAGWT
jgi:hypothetical protein